MDDRPLAALAHPYGDRLHNAAAVRFPVAGLDVHMQAAQTVRAMVAVIAAGVLRCAEPAAYLAGESVGAGVGLIVTFFKGFSRFIITPPEDVFQPLREEWRVQICQTSRSGHTLR